MNAVDEQQQQPQAEERKTQKRVVPLEKIEGHPLNRHFERSGEKWTQLVASIRTVGVIQPPLLRYLGDSRYQVICGHRRLSAAQEVGLVKVDCLVREVMTEREVLELLVIENLERENPDPVEEGKLIRALLAEGVEPEGLAHRLSRTVEWILTRQGLLDLGDEVCAAVRKPKDDPGHLHMSTVEVLLKVDAEDRPRAVQLVLHPEFQEEVLGARLALKVVKDEILEPKRLQGEWEAKAPVLVKAWRKRLNEYVTRDERLELIVEAMPWDKRELPAQRAHAEDLVSTHPLANLAALEGTERFVKLAIKHGIPVWVVPAAHLPEESVAVVDERLLRMGEKTCEELARTDPKVVYWLGGKGKAPAGESQVPGRRSQDGEGDGAGSPGNGLGQDAPATDTRVADALQVLDGGGEASYQDEEESETVVEQSMTLTAYCDLTWVMRMKAWAKSTPVEGWDGLYPLGLMPAWVDDEALSPEVILAMCDWVLSLKK